MSWRVIAAVLVAVFAALLVSMTTADPLHQVGDTFEDIDGGGQDVEDQANMGERAYGNLILIIVFGVLAWGAWFVLREEVTRGGGGGL